MGTIEFDGTNMSSISILVKLNYKIRNKKAMDRYELLIVKNRSKEGVMENWFPRGEYPQSSVP